MEHPDLRRSKRVRCLSKQMWRQPELNVTRDRRGLIKDAAPLSEDEKKAQEKPWATRLNDYLVKPKGAVP
jgi:hypothetical protein